MSTRKRASNPAKVSRKTILAFTQGYLRKFSDTFGMLEDHNKEQVLWRTQKTHACMDNGTCLFCGCDMPAKLYADEACEDPVRMCYPDMMSKEEWEKFKIENRIEVVVKPK